MPAKIRFYKEAKSGITTPAAGYLTLFTGSDALVPDGTGTLNHLTAIDSSGNQLVIPYLDEALTNYRGLAFKGDVDMNALLTLTSTTANILGRIYLGSTGLTTTADYNEVTIKPTDDVSVAAYNHMLEDNVVMSTTGITYIAGSLTTSTYGNTYISLSNGSGDTASIGALPANVSGVTSNEYQLRMYDPSNAHQVIITPTGMTIEVSGTSQVQLHAQNPALVLGNLTITSSGITSTSSIQTSGLTLSSTAGNSSEILTRTVCLTSGQTANLDNYHNRVELIPAPGSNEVIDVMTASGYMYWSGYFRPYTGNTDVYLVTSGYTNANYMGNGAQYLAPMMLSGGTQGQGETKKYGAFVPQPTISEPLWAGNSSVGSNMANMGLGEPVMIATKGYPMIPHQSTALPASIPSQMEICINVMYRITSF